MVSGLTEKLAISNGKASNKPENTYIKSKFKILTVTPLLIKVTLSLLLSSYQR